MAEAAELTLARYKLIMKLGDSVSNKFKSGCDIHLWKNNVRAAIAGLQIPNESFVTCIPHILDQEVLAWYYRERSDLDPAHADYIGTLDKLEAVLRIKFAVTSGEEALLEKYKKLVHRLGEIISFNNEFSTTMRCNIRTPMERLEEYIVKLDPSIRTTVMNIVESAKAIGQLPSLDSIMAVATRQEIAYLAAQPQYITASYYFNNRIGNETKEEFAKRIGGGKTVIFTGFKPRSSPPTPSPSPPTTHTPRPASFRKKSSFYNRAWTNEEKLSAIKTGRCFKCGSIGHHAKLCPTKTSTSTTTTSSTTSPTSN